jgi:HEAT repeat protein
VAIAVALLVSAAVYAFWPSDPLNWQPKGLAEKARNLSVGGKLDEDVAAKLAAEGDVALPVLRFLVEKGPPEKQIPAAKTLGMIATPRSRALLVEQLGHRRIEVRAEVLMILGRSTWPGAYEHLAKALEAKEPEVRRNAVIALGEFGDPRAIPLIHARLQDGDVSVRQQAKTSLDRLGGSAPTDGATPPRTGQEQ